MKTRIISGLVGIVLFVAVVSAAVTVNDLILLIFTTVIGCIGVYEAVVTTGYAKSKLIAVLAIVYAAAAPFVYSLEKGMLPRVESTRISAEFLLALYAVVLFIVAMFKHKSVAPSDAAFSFTAAAAIPYCFWSLSALFMSDRYVGLFYFLVVFVVSWGSDTGAYFTGYFFGKHKLAPIISPKKTVEGAVGGVVVSTLLVLVACIIYNKLSVGNVYCLQWVLVTPVLSVASMLGDLIFSYIKRACGIKDYGKLMPGHGGVLDRFDSVAVVAPLIYMYVSLIPVGS